jgi:hypothetical protein
MTVLMPGAKLAVLFPGFALGYLLISYASAGLTKYRYGPARHAAKHRRTVTA